MLACRRVPRPKTNGQIPPPAGFEPERVTAFVAWLEERGRTPETADLYRSNVLLCATDPKGLTHRLIRGSLSPLSRRTNLAALSQWARFTKNGELTERLSELKLPPARRTTVKVPLEVDAWRNLIRHIETCPFPKRTPVMRDIHLVIARRGLRVSDALRVTKHDLETALSTGTLSFVAKGNRRLEYNAKPITKHLESILEHGESHWGAWESVGDLLDYPGRTTKHKSRYHRVRRALLRHVQKCFSGDEAIEDVYLHRFRRTYATAYLKALVGDPQAAHKLQKHMGWQNINTAMGYVDAVSQDELDKVGDQIAGMLED